VCAEARFTWAEHGRRRRSSCQLLATGQRVEICRRTDRSGSRGCAEVSSSQLSALMRRIGCVPLISPTPPDLVGADPSQRNEMWEPAPARSSPMSRSRELAPLHGPPRPAELADHHLHGRLVGLLRREDAAGWRWSGPGPARRSRGGRMKPTEAARYAPSCIVCGVVVGCSGFCERVVCAEAICSRCLRIQFRESLASSMSTEGEPPCSPPVPARDDTVVWCQLDRAVVLSDPLLLSRGDVLCLSLTTGRSSSLLGQPSPLVLLDAHRPGAACADAPGRGITNARFRFSGWPSRGRWQRGRTVARTPDSVPCPAGRHWRIATTRPASPWFRPRL
jgi:hypothetical protein